MSLLALKQYLLPEHETVCHALVNMTVWLREGKSEFSGSKMNNIKKNLSKLHKLMN